MKLPGGKKFWGLTCALIVLNTAGLAWIHYDLTHHRRGNLRVLSVLPSGPADGADRLAILFDEPLTAAALIGRPLDRSPFQISPHVGGFWQWAAPDRLEFVLDSPLPPGRKFSLRPADDVELQTGRSIVGQSSFELSTRPLDLVSCELRNVDRDTVYIEFTFNQPVHPQDLLDHLTVDAVGKQSPPSRLSPSLVTREPAERLLARVDRPDRDLSARLDAALTGHGGELNLVNERVIPLTVARAFKLDSATCYAPGVEELISFYVRFSNSLDQGQPLPAVRVSPEVADLDVNWGWGDNIRISGRFDCARTYRVEVPETLRATDGQTLGQPAVVHVAIPSRNPTVSLPARGGILSPHGNMLLDVQATNVPGLLIQTSRVHRNNLVHHLDSPYSTGHTSRELEEKKVKLDLPPNKPTTVSLELDKLFGKQLGIYRVAIGSTDERWTRDAAVIAVTDLALTAKQSRDGLLVWVTSLRTGKPAEGAKVAAVTRNNQTIATAFTDATGLTSLRVPPTNPDGPVWLITAELGDDMSYLQPDERPWVVDGVDTAGRATPEAYDVMLYAERGVYRPGETVHLTGIVRDAAGQTPPSLPLAVRVYRPDGKQAAELAVRTDATQGLFHCDWPGEAVARTGRYRFAATLPGGEEAIGQTAALIEAFVPVRMEVKASGRKSVFGPGDQIAFNLEARYLFGQPAAHLPVSVTGAYNRAAYESKRFPSHRFDSRAATVKRCELVDGWTRHLDEDGKHEIELDPPQPAHLLLDLNAVPELPCVPANWRADRPEPPASQPDVPTDLGFWKGWAAVTVTEPGGRSVSSNVTFFYDPLGRHVGLLPPDSRIVRANNELSVPVVIVDADDKPVGPARVSWSLARIEYDWTIEEVNGGRTWKSLERPIPAGAGEATVSADGQGVIRLRMGQVGSYRLTVRDLGSGSTSSIELYANWPGGGDGFVVNQPDRLELMLDKDHYVPGSTARLAVKSPFTGTMLLTVETDRVVEQRVVELTAKSSAIDVPVSPTLRGGAFISAMVVRPMDPTQEKWMPLRAIGVARLATTAAAHQMPLRIDAVQSARPGDVLTVKVTAASALDPDRPGRVHLWAVDDGILLCTRFKTPDPLAYFFAHRRLDVTSADIFYDLLPDHRRGKTIARIGAGEDVEDLSTSPVPIRTRESAVVWRTATALDAAGQATLQVALPPLTGRIKLMAVAVDHDRYGSADRAVTVTAPLMVEASWPRVVGPGDRFRVPVKVFNTTAGDLIASVRLTVDGPIAITGGSDAASRPDDASTLTTQPADNLATATTQPDGRRVDATTQPDAAPRVVVIRRDGLAVLAGQAVTLWFDAVATAAGQVEAVSFAEAESAGRADAQAETFRADQPARFTVRTARPIHTVARLLRVEAGKPLDIAPPAELDPQTARVSLSVSGRPTVQLQPAVDYLIDYPYGCVEQTTSRLYALLHARSLLPPDDARLAGIDEMTRAGVMRLWSMQTQNGGLAYWPGDWNESLWGSLYAASYLARARQAGVAMDKTFIDDFVRYIDDLLRRSNVADQLNDNRRAEICRLLAAFDKPPLAWMETLSDRAADLDLAGRANLAGAWIAAGRKDRAARILTEDTLAVTLTAQPGAPTTQAAQWAQLLDVLLDLDANHPWVAVLAQRVDQARQTHGQWGNTLTNALCVMALARYQTTETPAGSFSGQIVADGRTLATFDQSRSVAVKLPHPARPLQITSTGRGAIYAVLSARGLRADGQDELYDRNLEVRRRWLNVRGQEVDPAKVKVGDLVQVIVTVRAPGLPANTRVDNVAIVDALPGGFEVENPRLETSSLSDANRWADHSQMLDDRMVIFTGVDSTVREFSYAIRAISAGSFAVPPVQAAGMYDASFSSIHGGGRVEVAP